MVHVCTRACMSEASECPCKRNHDDPNGPPHTPRLGGIPHLHIQDVTPVQTSSIYCLFIAYLDLLYCSIRMLHRYSAVGKSLHIHIRAHNTCIYICTPAQTHTHVHTIVRAWASSNVRIRAVRGFMSIHFVSVHIVSVTSRRVDDVGRRRRHHPRTRGIPLCNMRVSVNVNASVHLWMHARMRICMFRFVHICIYVFICGCLHRPRTRSGLTVVLLPSLKICITVPSGLVYVGLGETVVFQTRTIVGKRQSDTDSTP